MGSFYCNLVVVDGDADEVRGALAGMNALCSGRIDDAVAVFPDDHDGTIDPAAAVLSSRVDGLVLAASVYDDDIFACSVWRHGELLAQAQVPDPAAYFGLDPAELEDLDEVAGEVGVSKPLAEGAEAVVDALARGDRTRAIAVLTGDYVMATDRHSDLLAALGLPTFAAGWGHQYLTGPDADRYDGPPLVTVT